MLHLREDCSEKLLFFAKKYESAGFCVIPLVGNRDPDRAKQPAIKWGRYQHRRSTTAEHAEWFVNKGYCGLGIVLGRVSNLVVLDFDDAEQVSEFRHLYPDLADTYEVESGTRQLPHLYYRLEDGLTAHSRSVPGIDFRADGAYVVAPPTHVDGAEWRVVNDVQPRILSKADLNRIYRFLASVSCKPQTTGLQAHSQLTHHPLDSQMDGHYSGRAHDVVNQIAPANGGCMNSDTSVHLVAIYKARVTVGRNNALFQASCIGRDMGWSEEAVRGALANVHALERSDKNHRERFRQRYVEAFQTISSVFTRPARRTSEQTADGQVNSASASVSGLSNGVREWLLNHRLAPVARVVDGLYLAGLKAGSVFTERQACGLLERFRIGRRSIMTALKSLLPDNLPVFQQGAKPPCNPPDTAIAAADAKDEITKCDFVTGANRVKTSGRPAQHYSLPSDENLAVRLGVGIHTPTNQSDKLTVADLQTPAAYRRGLHRELLNRRPGQYSRRWLSDRLGVSKWTSRRYESALEIQVQPVYMHQVITWAQVESLPRTIEDAQAGVFLEASGKRYPPLQLIAARLVAKGHTVVLKRRTMNHYQAPGVGIHTPPDRQVSENAITWRKTDLGTKLREGVGIHTPLHTPHAVALEHSSQSQWQVYDDAHMGRPLSSHNGQSSTHIAFSGAMHIGSSGGVGIHTPSRIAPSEAMDGGSSRGVGIHTPPRDWAISSKYTEAENSYSHLVESNANSLQNAYANSCQAENAFWYCPSCLKTHIQVTQPSTCARCGGTAWEQVPDLIWRDQGQLKRWWQGVWRAKYPGAARRATPLVKKQATQGGCMNSDTLPSPVAQQAHQQVDNLSLENASTLVARYGEAQVGKALRVVRRRTNLTNPAGFLIILLKTENLFYKNDDAIRQSSTPNAQEWVEQMEGSAYVDFLVNGDEFLSKH